MHQLLKSVPATDFVIDVFAAALQKDIAIQGKCFSTQNRLCFYSNLFGFVNIVIVMFNQIQDIAYKPGAFANSIVITTEAGAVHIFKTISKSDRILGILSVLWKNARNDKPMLAQDLMNHVIFIYDDPPRRPSVVKSNLAMTQCGTPEILRCEAEIEYQLPIEMSVPSEAFECGCNEHLDKKEHDLVLQAPAKKVFEIMFGKNSNVFWETLFARIGASERMDGPWTEIDGEMRRETVYTQSLNNPLVKVKEATVKETSRILQRIEYFCYVVEINTVTPQLPFGDCFSPAVRICICWISPDSCRFFYSIGMSFPKSTIMKSIIKASGLKGLAETSNTTVDVLTGMLSSKPAEDLANSQSHRVSLKNCAGRKSEHFQLGISNWVLALLFCSVFVNCMLFMWSKNQQLQTNNFDRFSEIDWEKELKPLHARHITDKYLYAN